MTDGLAGVVSMFFRHRVVASLLGVIVAFGGLIVELVALPMARFGEPIFTYVAEKAPSYESQLIGSVIAWIVAAIIPVVVALAVNLKSSLRDVSPWVWGLFGFGLPGAVSFGVAFVVGGATYSTGVIPDHAAETPWLILANVVVYGGAVALLVVLVFALVMRGDSQVASNST